MLVIVLSTFPVMKWPLTCSITIIIDRCQGPKVIFGSIGQLELSSQALLLPADIMEISKISYHHFRDLLALFVRTDLSIWVGDLAPEVDDLTLLTFFQQHYKSVRSARVVLDNATMTSKGYGFVRFMDEQEFQRAISEMNGQVLMGRCIKIALGASGKRSSYGVGTPVGNTPFRSPVGAGGGPNGFLSPISGFSDPKNVLKIQGLPLNASKHVLKSHFSKFGSVLQVELEHSEEGAMLTAHVTFDSHIPVRYLLTKGNYSYQDCISCPLAVAPPKTMSDISFSDPELDLEEIQASYILA
jgi:hypothetical protein